MSLLPKRIIVCGGRRFDDGQMVYRVLDKWVPTDPCADPDDWPTIVHGGASGADSLADDWCLGRDVQIDKRPAEWDVHGRAAGPIRNQEMVDAGADLVISFPGGRGTADLLKRAKAAGIPAVEPCTVCDEPTLNPWAQLASLCPTCWAARPTSALAIAQTERT